ncbi:MAG: hypothetical protein KKF98_06550 [Bacteroidetes bacterium]|nr:hypothetical protein [Bacteroidota bacterium]
MKDIDYDNLSSLEKELGLPLGSMKSIPIYARIPAADAIARVMEMERKSLFRPGLYYIVLADLTGNTKFNANYGNAHADLRVQWFHTAVIQSIGEIKLSNYVTFSKTIGDASLLIFSSIHDVINWSEWLNLKLEGFDKEYEMALYENQLDLPVVDEEIIEQQIEDFTLKARRLVHIGEVRYTDQNDPLSLAVSQTFKMEKEFSETKLGCTEIVAKTIRPTIQEIGFRLEENRNIRIAGEEKDSMSYYIVPYKKNKKRHTINRNISDMQDPASIPC